MENLLHWLISVEQLAASFYATAAPVFSDDPVLSRLLLELAEEEEEHHRLLCNAAESLVSLEERAAIHLDPAIHAQVENRFGQAMDRLLDGRLSRGALLELIVETEFSEWNDIFLYVMTVLRGHDRSFQKAAAAIQKHKEEIEDFFHGLPDGSRYLSSLQILPPIWAKRILVVEDEPAVSRLLKSILAQEGQVDTAKNGREGLAKIECYHYDAIISDIEMPVMDGIEFYQQVMSIDADLEDHFIFFSGSRKQEHRDFMRLHHIVRVPKPASVKTIRQTVSDVAHRHRIYH